MSISAMEHGMNENLIKLHQIHVKKKLFIGNFRVENPFVRQTK